MNDVVIVAAKRTPIGSFGGQLASLSACDLGAMVIFELLKEVSVAIKCCEEVYMGNVLSANLGQAPARQAALKGGLPNAVPCTTINKVCASGMQAILLAADRIRIGEITWAIAGGMESMSNVPFYNTKMRRGHKLGHTQSIDGIIRDGLWDIYNNFHMGNAAELCAKEFDISRQMQDTYTTRSYKNAQKATKEGYFDQEIITVKMKDRKKNAYYISEDEEPKRVNYEKISTLRPVFDPKGTVTAANASSINDGAAAVLLTTPQEASKYNLKPLAYLKCGVHAACEPEKFTIAPELAIKKLLKKSSLSINDIDLFEINEAFSVVPLANMKLLNIAEEKMNIHGGAVSLGHPIGCSGARIVVTLIDALNRLNYNLGCASICNGGGGASALLLCNQ